MERAVSNIMAFVSSTGVGESPKQEIWELSGFSSVINEESRALARVMSTEPVAAVSMERGT